MKQRFHSRTLEVHARRAALVQPCTPASRTRHAPRLASWPATREALGGMRDWQRTTSSARPRTTESAPARMGCSVKRAELAQRLLARLLLLWDTPREQARDLLIISLFAFYNELVVLPGA
jgi:hypothetical protein